VDPARLLTQRIAIECWPDESWPDSSPTTIRIDVDVRASPGQTRNLVLAYLD
jgi:hypothetical protein